MTDDELRANGWVRIDHFKQPADQNLLRQAGWVQQSRRTHNLHGTPRVGQVFWVDFPHDAYSPEFVGEHPGVIVRAANNMLEPVILVPLTHRMPVNNPHAHKLARNPDKRDAADAFAICNHLYTIALGRLRRFEMRGFARNVFLDRADLTAVFAHVQRAIAPVYAMPPPVLAPPAQPKQRGPNTLTMRSKP